MKIIKTQKYSQIENKDRKDLALKLLEWHGGQWSPLYSVGSTWLAGRELPDHNNSIQQAIRELEDIAQKKVNHPETVTEETIAEVRNLQNLLRQEMKHDITDTPMGLEDDNLVSGIDY